MNAESANYFSSWKADNENISNEQVRKIANQRLQSRWYEPALQLSQSVSQTTAKRFLGGASRSGGRLPQQLHRCNHGSTTTTDRFCHRESCNSTVSFCFSIAATRSLVPEPHWDTILMARTNGMSSGCTRSALRT